MDVRNHAAIRLDRLERRPINHVRTQTLHGREPGTLADDHAYYFGAKYLPEMIFDSNPRVADKDRLHQIASRFQCTLERLQQRDRIFFDRRRRQSVADAYEHRSLSRLAASTSRFRCRETLHSRDMLRCDTPPALRIPQVIFATKRLRMHFDKIIAPRPIARNRRHNRIDGARMIGAQREHRRSRVTRPCAPDVETRRRRIAHRIEIDAVWVTVYLRRRIHQQPRVTGTRSES